MSNWLQYFNNNYAEAVQALTPIILGVVSFIYYKIYKERQLKEGDAAFIVSPIFFSLGRKFKILAVPQFEASSDISGYHQLKQNSRPDQWEKLIKIKSEWGNLKHTVVTKNKKDILTVIISRDGKEKWKTINFNR